MRNLRWHAPSLLVDERPRPRVIAALRDALRTPVLLLVAASGYGKTLAARQLFTHWAGNKAWLDIRAHGAESLDLLPLAAQAAWGLDEHASTLPALLPRLSQAEGGLLVLDEPEAWPDDACWLELERLAEALPAHCHLLLLCRLPPPLPLPRWQAQQRAGVLDHHILALDEEEWTAAGLDGGVDACHQALGWWGAERAARSVTDTHSGWNPTLGAWLDEAWFARLPADDQAAAGALSLLPRPDLALFCALSACSRARAADQLARLVGLSGPVAEDTQGVFIGTRYRPHIADAWRRADPEAWTAAVERGVRHLLEHGDYETAAQLAQDGGLPACQDAVLLQAGWTLLYGAGRALLESLLAGRVGQQPAAIELLRLAWEIEVLKRPHRSAPVLQQLLPQLEGETRGQALALMALIAWDFDDFPQARRLAEEAQGCFRGTLAPAALLARQVGARAIASEGLLDQAEPLLRHVHACATRDHLIHLQLDCLQRRAQLAAEQGDAALALALLADLRLQAAHQGVEHGPVLDSARRQLSWLHLRRLDLAAAETALGAGEPYWGFAQRLQHALLALARGDLAAAAEDVQWLKQRQAEQFICLKWKNEVLFVRIWLTARQLDQTALLRLETELQQEHWPPSLHRDRHRVLLAAVRLLAERPDDEDELEALHVHLHTQGAHALARQLALILGLRARAPLALLHDLRDCAVSGEVLDYVWLANKSVGPLEKLCGAPELVHDTRTLDFVRGLLRHLVAPVAPSGSAEPEAAPPPAGLTDKEWQILQLIADGLRNEQIAARLFISLATVKTHINHIYRKLDIGSRVEAVQRARSLATR